MDRGGFDRRSVLVGLAALLGAACRRSTREPSPSEPGPATGGQPYQVLDWRLEPPAPGLEARCVVLVPRHLPPARQVPLLVALHGAGETVDARSGAHGWLASYGLGTAYQRLLSPPLTTSDFQGLVTADRLASLNGRLASRPFGGLVIACPYVPRSIGREVPIETYGRWLGDRLLPRLRRETPVSPRPEAAGIDGVSFGGALALRLGLQRPDLFGVIGALQPALHLEEVPGLADEVAARLAGRPLRLVTSTEDHFRAAILALHAALEQRSVPHEHLLTEGPHSYRWNRGPGALELLEWHDRILRRAQGPSAAPDASR